RRGGFFSFNRLRNGHRCSSEIHDGESARQRIRYSCRTAVREVGTSVRRKGIPKQDQSCFKQRYRRGTAAQAYTSVLWMLRLAFLGARTLAACETAAHFSERFVCRAGARGTAQKSYCRKFEAGSYIYSRGRPRQLRTTVR